VPVSFDRPTPRGWFAWPLLVAVLLAIVLPDPAAADRIKQLQTDAITTGHAEWGHWGTRPERYSSWTNHSNRLIPVYVFGGDLASFAGEKSVYRDAQRLEQLYGRVPPGTLNSQAEYFDQTDLYHLQMDAVKAGKKYVFLFVFDGMDWQTTQAAATYNAGRAAYTEGRGTGLHFQDYCGAPTDFGLMVTSPHNTGTKADIKAQQVKNPGGKTRGGYDPQRGNVAPWLRPPDRDYLIGKSRARPDAVTDSAASATSMTSGIKSYNGAINVDPDGQEVVPIARTLQKDHLWSVGAITSVPISHATPAAAYANNVHRDDYQNITRDLVGLRSAFHRDQPLEGLDVLIGGGWGEKAKVGGNKYIDPADLKKIDRANGGRYVVAQRTSGKLGSDVLAAAADEAAAKGARLFGLFGVKKGHLPFQTADGGYDPAPGGGGVKKEGKEKDVKTKAVAASSDADKKDTQKKDADAKDTQKKDADAKDTQKKDAEEKDAKANEDADQKESDQKDTGDKSNSDRKDDKKSEKRDDNVKGDNPPADEVDDPKLKTKINPAEEYTPADLFENPTLAGMTRAAIQVLSTNPKGFWLMVEAGDVDWANHDNNIDNSIGAVLSGDDAFRVITNWVEAHDAWDQTLVVVTADHGHYLVLRDPEALVAPTSKQSSKASDAPADSTLPPDPPPM